MPELVLFALVLAVGQFSPGPDMLLLTHTSLHHGRQAGWWMTAGITTGLAAHASIAVFGLNFITNAFPPFLSILRWVAVAYFVDLAVRLWHTDTESAGTQDDHSAELPPPAEALSPLSRFYLRGLACNLLNPKAMIFFAALVASFLGTSPEPARAILLGSIIVIEGLLLWGLWVSLLQHPIPRALYQRSAPLINRSFALLLLLLAAKIHKKYISWNLTDWVAGVDLAHETKSIAGGGGAARVVSCDFAGSGQADDFRG